jgi:hypothetical protein
MKTQKGPRYVGEFREGLREGQGTHFYPSGAKYEGEYKAGYADGRGIYTYPAGSYYFGEFRKDSFNGYGLRYTPETTVDVAGIWADGKIKQRLKAEQVAFLLEKKKK